MDCNGWLTSFFFFFKWSVEWWGGLVCANMVVVWVVGRLAVNWFLLIW